MNNLDVEAAKILSVFLDYEKRVTPRLSIWIRLSFFPLALATFLGFIHRLQNIPYHTWENVFSPILLLSIQSLILGSIIQHAFFARTKNKTEIMMDWFSLDREYLFKIEAHPLEGIKHYSEYLNFNLNFREKTIDLTLVGSAAVTGLFLALTRVVDEPIRNMFVLLGSLAVVATITFIRDRKLLVQLRRFDDLLRKTLASGGGLEEGAGIAAAKGRSASEAGAFSMPLYAKAAERAGH